MMRPKAKSKDQLIEELEEENIKLVRGYCDLKLHSIELERRNDDLGQELSEVRERYADLLERYIKTMERMVRIDEQRE